MKFLSLILSVLLLVPSLSQAQEESSHNHFSNFAIVYGAQWAFYLVNQQETIKNEGSFDNWTKYPFNPGFDKDTFDYNLFKHAWAGQYYYLFYRSQGYTKEEAFAWTFLSSLAFEFTIETVTERPSFQDIYQTPVFGSIVGVGFEKLSIYFHDMHTWYGTTLGYILNPFTLFFPQNLTVLPVIQDGGGGAMVTWRF